MGIGLWGYLSVAVLATIAGSVPFGPVNLTVVNLAIKKSLKNAMIFSLAASFVEILLALLAIYFGKVFESFFENNAWIQILIFVVFIVLGLANLIRVTRPKLGGGIKLRLSDFSKGIVIAAVNPQVIIFWIFALTFVNQQFNTEFSSANLIVFLVGVFGTKLLVLFGFGKLGSFLKDRLAESCTLINRTMGVVLLAIGLIQAYRYFFT